MLAGLALALALVLTLGGCGGSAGTASHSAGGRSHRARGARTRTPAPKPVAVRLAYRSLYSLPAPLRDPAFAAVGGTRFAMLGGLDAADSSSSEVQVADLHHVLHSTVISSGAQHDAQGAFLDGKVFVFGGGAFTELDHILSFAPPGGPVTPVGSLPHAQSDVAVSQYGGTAYIVGGYDGNVFLNTILAWRPGAAPRVVGHLPVGLRYSAVAVADGGLLVVGGSTPNGASDAIYRFDLRTDQVRQLGRLPHPVTHGGAAALGAEVYLVGGRGDPVNAQTASVWSIDPLTGRVRSAGRLPEPISDAAVLTIGGGIVVAGGQSPGATLAGVGELVPAGSP
jgi:hypothetical protein